MNSYIKNPPPCKKVLFLSLLLIFTFFLFIPNISAEDYRTEDLLDSVMLGTIIVTAQRAELDQNDTAGNVTVYTKEDIEKSTAKDLGEALKYISGVDISVTNQFGQPTSLTIHGSASRQVLIMIDGIPFNTQLSGQADPTMIPIDHVERIEVIKGASSSAWGSSLGGVINVITKDVGDSATPRGVFKSTYAEFSTTKNSLELAGKIATLGYFVSGSYMETDGIKSRSDVQENRIFGKLSIPVGDEAKIISSFGYSGAQVHDGVNSDDTWNSLPYISRYGQVALDLSKEDNHFQMACKYNDQDITTDTYIASTGILNSSTVNHNTYQGISLNGSIPLRDEDIFVFGSDFDWHEFKSSNYLETSKRIAMQAPYTNYTLKWHNWDFIPGVRYDHNQEFGSQTSPSFGVVYHWNDSRQSLVRAKVSRAFNAPPLMWIYNDDASLWVGPNPDLKAERGTVYELGYETQFLSSIKVKLDLYRADIKDALALVFDGGVYKYDNFRKFRRQGAELSLRYAVNDQLTLYANGAFNDVENRETGEIVRDADIARQSFSLGGSYESKGGLGINVHGYYNRWSADPDEANDRKFIFDVKFVQALKDLNDRMDAELFLNIYNITNSKYWSNPTYPLPERYFEGGFSVKF